MRQAPGPLREELNRAVIVGIRERGAEAVGLVILALARLLIAVLALALLLALASIFGCSISAGPVAAASLLSTTIGWTVARDRDPRPPNSSTLPFAPNTDAKGNLGTTRGRD